MRSVSQQRLFIFGHLYDSNGQEYTGRYGPPTKCNDIPRYWQYAMF